MTLNTIDGNKIKLWIYFVHLRLEISVVPLTDLRANPLAHEVSTQIGPRWLPLAVLYENRFQSNNNQAWYDGIEFWIKKMHEPSSYYLPCQDKN